MPGSEKQNSMFKKTKGYVQKSNPLPVTSCGRRRNDGSPLLKSNEPRKTTKGKDYDHKDGKFKSIKANRGNDGKGTKKE